MTPSIPADKKELLFGKLKEANTAFQKIYPGDRSERQPVHTLYGGANLLSRMPPGASAKSPGNIRDLRTGSYRIREGVWYGYAIGVQQESVRESDRQTENRSHRRFPYPRFEDGYGNRSNEEEDETAVTAKRTGKGNEGKHAFSLYRHTHQTLYRGDERTGIAYAGYLHQHAGEGNRRQTARQFRGDAAKVTIPEQPATLAGFDILESELKLEKGVLKMEMMVETTQSIMAIDGTTPCTGLSKKTIRCIAMHFGTYDYTASCSITAKYRKWIIPFATSLIT